MQEGYKIVPVFVDNETACVGYAVPAFTKLAYRFLGIPVSIPYWKGKPKITVQYGSPIDASGGEFDQVACAFWEGLAMLREESSKTY